MIRNEDVYPPSTAPPEERQERYQDDNNQAQETALPNAVVVEETVQADRVHLVTNVEAVPVEPCWCRKTTKCQRWVLVVVPFSLIAAVVVLSIFLSKRSKPPGPTLSQEDLRDLLGFVSSDGGDALQTDSTPQNMAFTWLVVNNTNLGVYTYEKIIQRYALATLYFSTNGDSWEHNKFWMDDGEECGSWQTGYTETVICTDAGALLDLDLSDNYLNGTLPPEIGLLSSLETLILGINALEGSVPTEIGQLTQLTDLQLNNNKLTGAIPSEIGLLSSLETLSLYRNSLDGTMPSKIGQLLQLTSLDLSDNALTGTVPSEINGLSNLEVLHLSSNELTGAIPSEAINDLTNLGSLNLYNNTFTGDYTCPDFITYCGISCNPWNEAYTEYNDTCRSL